MRLVVQLRRQNPSGAGLNCQVPVAYSARAMRRSFAILFMVLSPTIASCRNRVEKVASTAVVAAAQAGPPGFKKEEVKIGGGATATKGKIVQVHYTGYLPDGTTFDTTRQRKPLQFQLGQGTVLKGWDLGIEGMKVGGKRKLTLPPALAFGDRAVGQIKPNSTLVFDVELVTVQ